MRRKFFAGFGILALATIAVLMFAGPSHARLRDRRAARTGMYYYDTGSVTMDGAPTANPPYYGDGYAGRYRSRFFNRNSYSPQSSDTGARFVPAGSDTVTYSTSGYRPNAASSSDDRAHVRLALPSERADVWIEGEKSEQSKRVQDYVSPPLTPGKKYYYEIRARWTENGKDVERSKTFAIYTGQPVLVDFTRPDLSDQGKKNSK